MAAREPDRTYLARDRQLPKLLTVDDSAAQAPFDLMPFLRQYTAY